MVSALTERPIEREPLDLEAAIVALLDREELADHDQCAGLARVRRDLERELGDALALE